MPHRTEILTGCRPCRPLLPWCPTPAFCLIPCCSPWPRRTAQNLGGGIVSGTLASMATLVNALNAVYEREFALRLQLVANNNLLIYNDLATDPYDNPNLSTILNGNQTVVDGAITSAAYDVGHLLGPWQRLLGRGLREGHLQRHL